ncbi:D-inositol-3-phosphate glycosyltransferase [Candidatus Venteria ishoeyi]|uniref:D-inositol-3-phosphate glycosyltransferase n=2 Tax=Candidatus Venteria ishoeyi TaxID=1899563 RepID=A0A1H6FD95_9GAMM|nr:D-inositol-3-phosphate glycosyltransferase [Candidatus Venteria ishoeyi]
MALNLLLSSTSYPKNPKDWRGIFIAHMVQALAAKPDIHLKVWAPPGELPADVEYLCTVKERKWLDNLMQRGGIAHLLRQDRWRAGITALQLLYFLYRLYQRESQHVDVLHVNWLQNALPLGKGSEPLLITVLGSDLKLLKLPGMVGLLRRVLRNRPSLIAPNAQWMVAPLQAQFGDVAEIRPIVFGIADIWYRLQRNWQAPKKKWLVVLRVTQKKIGPLFDWGEVLFKHTEHELHLFGPMQEQLDIPDWVFYHGATHPQALQTTWFPQAAGLISLSQHDEGRPQVMLEAMAAGLPIIASAIPAHENLLQDQQTGCLCHQQADFEQTIHRLSEAYYNEKIGQQARTWVKQNVGTWDDCGQRYLQAYQDLLERGT